MQLCVEHGILGVQPDLQAIIEACVEELAMPELLSECLTQQRNTFFVPLSRILAFFV
jgi:hypothetical protein